MSADVATAVRGVLFDLDGTLIDSAPDLGAAVNTMRLKRGLAELPDSSLRPYASHGARGLVGAGFNVTPEHADFGALRDEFLGYYATALCVRTVVFPDVPALLDALDAAKLPWGIVTNKVVLRVMVEAREAAVADEHARALAHVIAQAAG